MKIRFENNPKGYLVIAIGLDLSERSLALGFIKWTLVISLGKNK